MNNLSYLNEIDSDIVDQAANVEQHIRSRRKKKMAIMSGATGVAACFMFALGIMMWGGFDNNGVILTPPDTDVSNTESVQNPAQTTPKVTAPSIADNDKIVWNDMPVTAHSRAGYHEETTKEEWEKTFSFNPPLIESIPHIKYYLVYSHHESMIMEGLEIPVTLIGGCVQLSDGSDDSANFLIVHVSIITDDTKPLGELNGISDMLGIDFEMSAISGKDVVLSKSDSHILGAFDLDGYRIEFEGMVSEDVVIDFIKNCKPTTRIIAENQ